MSNTFSLTTIPKPRLVRYEGQWRCHDDYYTQGFGANPAQAYCNWLLKHSTISRIPRRGLWNIKDTRRWHSRGCPRMRYYFGTRQIIGYEPSTDELVLRG